MAHPLKDIYYTPREVGSFGSVNPLSETARSIVDLNRNLVAAWLVKQDTQHT